MSYEQFLFLCIESERPNSVLLVRFRAENNQRHQESRFPCDDHLLFLCQYNKGGNY